MVVELKKLRKGMEKRRSLLWDVLLRTVGVFYRKHGNVGLVMCMCVLSVGSSRMGEMMKTMCVRKRILKLVSYWQTTQNLALTVLFLSLKYRAVIRCIVRLVILRFHGRRVR
jgi:hypothetical protein